MKKSTFKFCVMLFAFCFSSIHLQAMDEWDGTTAKGFYSGTGTKANPYKIFTASQFLYFIQQIKDGNTFSGQYIELCNDIAFKSNNGLVEGGDFYGDFDGNDHIIQVNEYWTSIYYWYGWTLFNLYGTMHDVQFVNANEMMKIYTGGILYNCRFEFPNGSYHGQWTIYLDGGTIANCVSSSAYFKNKYEQGGSTGFVYGNRYSGQPSYCSNCYFPISSYSYGNTLASNYFGVIESCGEEVGNDWVQSHTEYDYKSWPLTFNPTYPEYQIKGQPKSYNPLVVCPNPDEALFQWYYQERKPITFEDITYSSSTQTKNIVISDDNVVLSFDFATHGYVSGRYDDNYHYAWVCVNGEEIVHVYDERAGTYSCQASAGTYEISCALADITNIRISYPIEPLANETSSILSKQTIMEKPGAFFCQVSYGAGCDVMSSDYVDYEKLLTIDDVTYVINEDATATLLWVADKAVNITIPESIYYDEANYPVTSISSKAFVDCTSLENVNCKSSDVPALLGGTTFEELIPSGVTLYVPVGSESAYSAANGWKEFSEIIGIETEIELVDGHTFSNKNNKVIDKITYTRTLSKTNTWNALYIPFEIPVTAEFLEDYDVAYFNDIHSFDNYIGDKEDGVLGADGVIDRMEMEVLTVQEGAVLNANYPYLIRAKNENALNMNIVVENATLYKAVETTVSCSSVFMRFDVTGIYTTQTSGELKGEFNVYAMSGGGWKQALNDAQQLKPFRLYLKLTSIEGSPVKVAESAMSNIRIRLDGEGEATGIERTQITVGKPDQIYDLQGRRVEKAEKGIYIINGKKVVIK